MSQVSAEDLVFNPYIKFRGWDEQMCKTRENSSARPGKILYQDSSHSVQASFLALNKNLLLLEEDIVLKRIEKGFGGSVEADFLSKFYVVATEIEILCYCC